MSVGQHADQSHHRNHKYRYVRDKTKKRRFSPMFEIVELLWYHHRLRVAWPWDGCLRRGAVGVSSFVGGNVLIVPPEEEPPAAGGGLWCLRREAARGLCGRDVEEEEAEGPAVVKLETLTVACGAHLDASTPSDASRISTSALLSTSDRRPRPSPF